MFYLAYMQDPNAADKVKIMFEIWKSRKHSTATTRQKKEITVMAGNVHFPA